MERETLVGRDGTGVNQEMVVSGVGLKIALVCSMCICSLVTSLPILHAVLLKSRDHSEHKAGEGGDASQRCGMDQIHGLWG